MKVSQLNTLLQISLIILYLVLLSPFTTWAQSQEQVTKNPKHFNGFNLGTSIGSQNIFGGAFIDDLDVLAQKSGLVIDFSVAYRKQFLQNRIMVGAEFFYGLTDGDLEEVDARNQMMIFYKNNTQLGLGLQAGGVLGKKKNVLLYLFFNETKRVFDIHFTTPDGFTYTQEDTQYFVRYGIGLEIPVYKRLNIKGTVANSYSDFGDLETSMDVNDKLDYNLGVCLNF